MVNQGKNTKKPKGKLSSARVGGWSPSAPSPAAPAQSCSWSLKLPPPLFLLPHRATAAPPDVWMVWLWPTLSDFNWLLFELPTYLVLQPQDADPSVSSRLLVLLWLMFLCFGVSLSLSVKVWYPILTLPDSELRDLLACCNVFSSCKWPLANLSSHNRTSSYKLLIQSMRVITWWLCDVWKAGPAFLCFLWTPDKGKSLKKRCLLMEVPEIEKLNAESPYLLRAFFFLVGNLYWIPEWYRVLLHSKT